jgi:hypothetical protein
MLQRIADTMTLLTVSVVYEIAVLLLRRRKAA